MRTTKPNINTKNVANESILIAFQLPQTMLSRIDRAAQTNGMSRSLLIRRALDACFKEKAILNRVCGK